MSGIIGGAGSKSGIIGETELDYEEGVFTLTHVGSTHGLGTQSCNYVRVGNLCSIYMDINFNADGKTSSANFSGLPFTSKNIYGGGGAAWPNSVGFYGSTTYLQLRIDANSKQFSFYCTGDDQGVNNTITTNNGSSMNCQGQYIIA